MATRVELKDGELEVVGTDFQGLVEMLAPNISTEGVFLETEEWLSQSAEVGLRIRLSDGFELIKAEGIVVWRRGVGDSSGPPGLAIRFHDLSESGRTLIDRIVEQERLAGREPFRLDRSSRPSPFENLDAATPADRGFGGLDEDKAPSFAPGMGSASKLRGATVAPLGNELRSVLGVEGAEKAAPKPEAEPAPEAPASRREAGVDSFVNLRDMLSDVLEPPDGGTVRATGSEEGEAAGGTARATEDGPSSSDGVAGSARDREEPPTAADADRATRDPAVESEPPAPEPSSASEPRAERASAATAEAVDEQEYAPADVAQESQPPPQVEATFVEPGHETVSDSSEAPRKQYDPADPQERLSRTDPMISASWLVDSWAREQEPDASDLGPLEPEGPELDEDEHVFEVEEPLVRSPSPVGGGASRRSGRGFVWVLVVAITAVVLFLVWQRLPSGSSAARGEQPIANTDDGDALDPWWGGSSLTTRGAGPRPTVRVTEEALTAVPGGRIERITWSTSPGATVVRLYSDGVFRTVGLRYVRLDGAQPREVLVIDDVIEPPDPPAYAVDSPQLEAVEVKYRAEGSIREASLVMTLARPEVRLQSITIDDDGIQLRLEGPIEP